MRTYFRHQPMNTTDVCEHANQCCVLVYCAVDDAAGRVAVTGNLSLTGS